MYQERLFRRAPASQPVQPAATSVTTDRRLVYLLYDQRDADVITPWFDALFTQGFEVVRPVFEGDEAEVREYTKTTSGVVTAH